MAFLNLITQKTQTIYYSLAYQAQQTISKYDETQVLQQTLAKAILGTAEPIETYNWVLSLETRPLLCKRVHVVTDQKHIIEIFHKGRNGAEFSSCLNDTLGALFGKENLLICPMIKHKDLRSPVELAFRPREVVKHFESQVSRALQLFQRQRDFDTSVVDFISLSLTEDLFGISDLTDLHYRLLHGDEFKGRDISQIIDKNTLKNSGLLNLILNDKQLTPEQKLSTIKTLYHAGMHTTSNFINAFRAILLLNPVFRTAIQLEWDQFLPKYNLKSETIEEFTQAFKLFVLGGKSGDEPISPSTWLYACYREASRLFPSVPTVVRLAETDMMLGDTKILKGDGVDLDILSANRNASQWDHSETFIPKRFINKNGELKTEDQIINFGMGAQGCIGKHFAKQEILIFVGLQTIIYDVCDPEDRLKNIEIRLDRHHTRVELSTETSESLEGMLIRNSRHPSVLPPPS